MKGKPRKPRDPWLGKCGNMHIWKQPCKLCKASNIKAYEKTEAGRAARRRANEKYFNRRIQLEMQRTKQVEKKNRCHISLEARYRSVLRRFLACFSFDKSEGFVIYTDKLPELQRLRELSVPLFQARVMRDGYIKEPK